jgi:hypothetical protein
MEWKGLGFGELFLRVLEVKGKSHKISKRLTKPKPQPNLIPNKIV